MTFLRRLDHVAVAVYDTDAALGYFRDRLGLPVAHAEDNAAAGVRMTYLDAGNSYIQLLSPKSANAVLRGHLERHGEGVHHLCFAVDDVAAVLDAWAGGPTRRPAVGSGRGRPAAFLPGPAGHGVRIECTSFDRASDVDARPGWLSD